MPDDEFELPPCRIWRILQTEESGKQEQANQYIRLSSPFYGEVGSTYLGRFLDTFLSPSLVDISMNRTSSLCSLIDACSPIAFLSVVCCLELLLTDNVHRYMDRGMVPTPYHQTKQKLVVSSILRSFGPYFRALPHAP